MRYVALDFLLKGSRQIIPTGSVADLQKKLDDIAKALPNIFTTAGDTSTAIENNNLTNVSNAVTNLATVTTERDNALDEANKLKAWKDNEAVSLKIFKERITTLEKLKTSDSSNATTYQTEIDEINKLIGEVTGLTEAKKKLTKEINDWITKYSHGGAEPLFSNSFDVSAKADEISGGDGTDGHHWGTTVRKGPKGHTWKDYIEGATSLNAGGELSLDEVKDNITMGILEAVFPEILGQYHEKNITKKAVEKFMNDNVFAGFWDSASTNTKLTDEIKKIDTKYSTNYEKMEMKAIVNALKRPVKTVTDWKDALNEISAFFTNEKPTTLKEIKEFLDEENYPNPIDGVDLNGKTNADLKTAFSGKEDSTVNGELPNATGSAAQYKNYIPVQSSKDGNCFLNSFSILLNGDETLATQLRVKLCLELMSGKWVDGSEADKVKEITEKLTNRTIDGKSCSLTKPGDWLAGDDIAYMVGILDRPIALIYRPDTTNWDKTKDAYKEVNKNGGFAIVEYPVKGSNPFGKPSVTGIKTPSKTPEWSIYHVNNNHFVPLIKK